MNIVLVAKSFPGSTTNLVFKTLKTMGHNVKWFEFPRTGGHNPPVTHRFKSALKQMLPGTRDRYMSSKNKELIRKIQEFQPDFMLVIKGEYLLPETIETIRKQFNIPCFLWFYDKTWSLSHQVLHTFKCYSRVFLKDKHLLLMLGNAGMNHLTYLPQACSPDIHRPPEWHATGDPVFECDVSFVGRHYIQREYLFSGLERYAFKIFGPRWDCLPANSPLIRCWQHRIAELHETVSIFHVSRININCFHFGEFDSLNVRVFEITGSGGFLLTEYKQLLSEFFEIETDIATFKNRHELLEKTRYFLDHEKECMEMAVRACKKIHSAHTYEHRLAELMTLLT